MVSRFVVGLFRKSRAQAAMEFLMTYGWAILVVLAAITALAYFGVLSPSKFLPESCTLSPTSGVACLDFVLTSDTAYLFLGNGGGKDIIVNNITVGDCTTSFDKEFDDGARFSFNVTGCDFGDSGGKVKKDIVIKATYPESGFVRSISGSITSGISG